MSAVAAAPQIGRTRRAWLIPEVVQTSEVDCGPASLKALLDGHGIPVSYGRLREACHTDVDGTSIDTLEELANLFGLDAEQVIIPVDHLFIPEAQTLPAIVVTEGPDGFAHFVVVWQCLGGWVQFMDPAVGRRWVRRAAFLKEVFRHTVSVPASLFREWAGSAEFRSALLHRFDDLGFRRGGSRLIDQACGGPDWRSIAAVDAAARFGTALVRAGAIRRGREAERIIGLLTRPKGDRPAPAGPAPSIPERYWSVREAPGDGEEDPHVLFRGAVLVRVRKRRDGTGAHAGEVAARSPELAAALNEAPRRPFREAVQLARSEGFVGPLVLAGGLALAAAAVTAEAVVLRGLIDGGRELSVGAERLQVFAWLALFGLAVLALELGIHGELARIGRLLEARLRMALLSKIPKLHDRYVQSRPLSDMAERSHAVQRVRVLPLLAGQTFRTATQLVLTVIAIGWLLPSSAGLAIAGAVSLLAIPAGMRLGLQERDLRVRAHGGALGRFYLDALLGLNAIRAHGAEQAVRREHEGLLVEWVRASRALLRWSVTLEAAQLVVGFAFAGWLIATHVSAAAEPGTAVLLAYWALSLPMLAGDLALQARRLPLVRSALLRVLDPLGAPEGSPHTMSAPVIEPSSRRGGLDICFESVSVLISEKPVVEDVCLRIPAGAHVAIVGRSGAGKSSLLGLLLGWYRPSTGRLLVDGVILDEARLDEIRRRTAWVDPAVHIWNRSLLENLLFGADGDAPLDVGVVLDQAELFPVLEQLPDGLRTPLGEGGRLVSGGEGQKVRLGRSLFRTDARLVLLDEPFRGLDRSTRRILLQRARLMWRDATLLCVTHDVHETQGFDHVIVMEDGRIVEEGKPSTLKRVAGSYRRMLAAEESVNSALWGSSRWRRIALDNGRLTDASIERGA